MENITLLTNSNSFSSEFEACAKTCEQLDIYTAWVGNPGGILPYAYLKDIPKINIVVGIAFCQTHPAGLRSLIELGTDLRIAKENKMFHSKVYIFSTGGTRSIFLGSSNFTYQGFFDNIEANVLIKGSSSDKKISCFEKELSILRSNEHSFKPSAVWLDKYSALYEKRRQKIKTSGITDEVEIDEQQVENSGWLTMLDWKSFKNKVLEGLDRHSKKYNEDLPHKLMVLNEASKRLKVPWRIDYFDDLENRKIIGGMGQYGFLGHVAASGRFRSLIAKGSSAQRTKITSAINSIAVLSTPLNWTELEGQLRVLVSLGPSMKVWGRLLALVRPDLFCTISSPRVRKLIASVLEVRESKIGEVEGYIGILKLIHASPWYNSSVPADKQESDIWQRRVAFIDVVFYE